MTHPHLFYPAFARLSRKVVVALSVGLLGLWPIMAIAQEYVPPVEGLPGRRQGGGTRGDCLPSDASLIALMPNSNFGQTLEDYPTFYWYVPEVAAEAAEFVLLDENDNEIYIAEYQLSNQSGIISLSLPATAGLPPLEVGQDYHWYFSLICDRLDRSGDLFTEGWVRRISDPSLAQQASQLSALDQATLYAESGIWYEALDILAGLRRDRPTDPQVSQGWTTLLNSVGLGELIDQPFIELNASSEEVVSVSP
jgi:hypothetical protein